MACFPAARVGDVATHDGALQAGTIQPAPGGRGQVWIEGAPAAHVVCPVLCSGLTSNGDRHPSSVHGAVAIGAASVLVHRQPAARWAPSGDVTTCGAQLGHAGGARTVVIGGPSGGRRKTLKVRIVVVKGTYWDSDEGRSNIRDQLSEAERILGINIDPSEVIVVDDPALKKTDDSPTRDLYPEEEVRLVNQYGSKDTVALIYTDDTSAAAMAIAKPWAKPSDGLQHTGAVIGKEMKDNPRVTAHELGHALSGCGEEHTHAPQDAHNDIMQPNATGDTLTEPWKSKLAASPYLQ